jgi:hypothetical protein
LKVVGYIEQILDIGVLRNARDVRTADDGALRDSVLRCRPPHSFHPARRARPIHQRRNLQSPTQKGDKSRHVIAAAHRDDGEAWIETHLGDRDAMLCHSLEEDEIAAALHCKVLPRTEE